MVTLLAAVACAGCADREPAQEILLADVPLHLEDHLDVADLQGSEVPTDIADALEWSFAEPQPGWKPAYWGYTDRRLTVRNTAETKLANVTRTDEALQLRITEENRNSDGDLIGSLHVDLPSLRPEEWSHVEVEARVRPGMRGVRGGVLILGFNLTEPTEPGFVQARSIASPLVADGTVQTYVLPADPSLGAFDGAWRQLVLGFVGDQPRDIDLLSVKVIPKEATFASARAGISTEPREGQSRRTLYMHAPGRLTYRVRIPRAGRLDVGLGAVRRDIPVTYRVTATLRGGDPETLLEETSAETEHWVQRSVDLSHLAGETVTLVLEALADRDGTVALWAAPTLTGDRATDKPNVIFYIIDGGGADYVSAYGYNRRTTPNLERLAAEGAIFERVHSNSSWTRPSTPSFLTSLQHSVLGGLRNGRTHTAPGRIIVNYRPQKNYRKLSRANY